MAGERVVRVLIVDDSAVMRSLVRLVLARNPSIEVAGVAGDGQEGLKEFERLHPDLVLLDIEMPALNGLEALSGIRRLDRRVPVIMCSTLTSRGALTTLDALSRGATDYVAKPVAQKSFHDGVEVLARELLPKIAALFPQQPPVVVQPRAPLVRSAKPALPPRVVVIGVSTGGPAALETILPQIPASFPLPILIVQHMPLLFTGLLAERLNGLCSVRVREAQSGAHTEAGVVEIARGDWHLGLTRDFRLQLEQSAPENFCRPSADFLFRTAAAATAGRVLGIILTGMGSDGLAGSRAICAAGGTVYAQDAATSVIWGMPGAIAHAGLAQKIIPLHSIAAEMQRAAAADGGMQTTVRETSRA